MSHVLLFSTEHRCLGELFFNEGLLERSVLTPAGERLIGTQVSSWQTEGILLAELRDRTLSDGTVATVVMQERVSIRTAQAEAAVRAWSLQENLFLIDVPPRLLPLWESLSELDLDDEERYSSMVAIRHASHRHLVAWQRAIVQVQQAMEDAKLTPVGA
jgi:hypothetical protein